WFASSPGEPPVPKWILLSFLLFGSPAVKKILTRGFASPPRDGFALIGKGSPHKQSRPEREAKVEHGICQRKNTENGSEKSWIGADYSGDCSRERAQPKADVRNSRGRPTGRPAQLSPLRQAPPDFRPTH